MDKKLYFENERGKVEMFLSGAGPVRVTALSGLGNPPKIYNTVAFAGRDGQKTLSAVTRSRTIIISGDVRLWDESLAENMMKIFHEPGNLTIDFGNKKRMIYCSQVDFEEGSRNREFMNFILTLTADGVYFTDTEQTRQPVFERTDLLGGNIIFPCMFTKKTTQAVVENFGNVNVEPEIIIYNCGDSDNKSGEIVVLNSTTGQSLKLMTDTSKNEIITIDISGRKVTSSTRGDITYLISDDTFLNKFWLSAGKNHISASHTNEGENISVVCCYYSNYREGIY